MEKGIITDISFFNYDNGFIGIEYRDLNGKKHSKKSRLKEAKASMELHSTDYLMGLDYMRLCAEYDKTKDPVLLKAIRILSIQDRPTLKGDYVYYAWKYLHMRHNAFNRHTEGKRCTLKDDILAAILMHSGNVLDFCRRNNISRNTYYRVKSNNFTNLFDRERVERLKQSILGVGNNHIVIV